MVTASSNIGSIAVIYHYSHYIVVVVTNSSCNHDTKPSLPSHDYVLNDDNSSLGPAGQALLESPKHSRSKLGFDMRARTAIKLSAISTFRCCTARFR